MIVGWLCVGWMGVAQAQPSAMGSGAWYQQRVPPPSERVQVPPPGVLGSPPTAVNPAETGPRRVTDPRWVPDISPVTFPCQTDKSCAILGVGWICVNHQCVRRCADSDSATPVDSPGNVTDPANYAEVSPPKPWLAIDALQRMIPGKTVYYSAATQQKPAQQVTMLDGCKGAMLREQYCVLESSPTVWWLLTHDAETDWCPAGMTCQLGTIPGTTQQAGYCAPIDQPPPPECDAATDDCCVNGTTVVDVCPQPGCQTLKSECPDDLCPDTPAVDTKYPFTSPDGKTGWCGECVDTDQPNDLLKKGVVTFADGTTHTDVCVEKGTEVKQVDCGPEGTLRAPTSPCPAGCLDGACLPDLCVDKPVDDQNLCTKDTCDPATGQMSHLPVACPMGQQCTPATGACAPVPSCGNGLLEAPEACDDGNTASGDGCDAACKPECPNYVYVANDAQGLQVVDITKPTAPTVVGSVDTPGAAFGVAVAGSYAYVATSSKGLQVVNVTHPKAPTLVGYVDTLGFATDVAVAGPYAYVASGYDGLKAVDITKPKALTLVGSVDTPGDALAVAVAGAYAYVADYSKGLQVVDITKPTFLTLVGSLAMPDAARAVVVAGSYAYVADYSKGLQVVDITKPTTPTVVGSVAMPGDARAVAVAGAYVYVANDAQGLQVVDITKPTAPTVVGSVDTPGKASRVAVAGSYAYVADGYKGLQVVDVTQPTAPLLVGSTEVAGNSFDIALGGFSECAVGPVTDPCFEQPLDDANACTTDACDVTTGQVTHTPVACPAGQACAADTGTCAPIDLCAGVPVDDTDPCTVDVCDSTTGAVTHTAVVVDDGTACTVDSCEATTGTVVHTPIAIDDANACTTDACDPATGQVTHTPVACPAGQQCTPATGTCAVLDVCEGQTVDDSDSCTADSCDPATGMIAHLSLTTEPSGKACTLECPAGETRMWEKVNENLLLNSQYYIRKLHSHNGMLFACTIYAGLLRSQDNGISWQAVNVDQWEEGTNAVSCEDIYTHKGNLYLVINAIQSGATHFHIYRSLDNGMTWELIEQNLSLEDDFFKGTPFFHTHGEKLLLPFYDGHVFQFNETTASWEAFVNFDEYTGLEAAETHNGSLFVGTNAQGIYHLVNGTVWQTVGVFPNTSYTTVRNLLSVQGTLYASGAIPLSPNTPELVYRSEDGGKNWVQVGGEVGVEYLKDLHRFKSEIFLATVATIYKLNENSNSWDKAEQGIETLLDFRAFETHLDKLYVADQENIYRYECATASVTDLCFEKPLDDANACTTDACDLATGQVSHLPVACPAGQACAADTGMCAVLDVCGNGLLEAPEACDDGNTASGDGCDAACQTECPSYAYVVGYANGLQVVDITKPTTPLLVGALDTPGVARAVAVAGVYIYVADGNKGLQVVDVTEPTTPTVVGSVDTLGYAYNVAVAGVYAYVADGASGLQVVDVTQPTTPTLVGAVDTPGYAYNVAVAGAYAYVADDTSTH